MRKREREKDIYLSYNPILEREISIVLKEVRQWERGGEIEREKEEERERDLNKR